MSLLVDFDKIKEKMTEPGEDGEESPIAAFAMSFIEPILESTGILDSDTISEEDLKKIVDGMIEKIEKLAIDGSLILLTLLFELVKAIIGSMSDDDAGDPELTTGSSADEGEFAITEET